MMRIAAGIMFAVCLFSAASAAEVTPTGQELTPTAARRAVFQALNPDLPTLPAYTAGQASNLALSPDGRTLLIMTTGYNRTNAPNGERQAEGSSEYVFVYDISGAAPVKHQVISIQNTFLGIAWAPSGDRFFVSAGMDDKVLEFARGAAGFAPGRTFALGHTAGLGLAAKPMAAGLAISPDGRSLLVANLQNDSVSLVDLTSGRTRELDLRRGGGQGGGSFPRAVAWSSNTRAFVAVERDREVLGLDLTAQGLKVGARIAAKGQPIALLVNPRGNRLYAALNNTDAVLAIDPKSARLLETIPTAAPPGRLAGMAGLGGAGSNNLALSPDGRTLLVSNGGQNAVAVIALDDRSAGAASAARRRVRDDDDDDKAELAKRSAVVGMIPTGWYPTGVAMRRDGRQIYVVNGKSNAGPNPGACKSSSKPTPETTNACEATNSYVWQLEKAGFLTLPTPSGAELGRLTLQVAQNNHFPGTRDDAQALAVMAGLHQRIRHVIYVVKENRTYDQVLGDLEVGDGDPRLAIFGRALTPNQHALARDFVTLDNFLDSGESSNTGWNWTTAARTNDFTEREAPVNYAGRGLQYDQEGFNRSINVGYATLAERRAANPATPDDPDILPGARDVAAPDGPGGAEGQGYLWDAALRAGVKVRNYGFYGDLVVYGARAGAGQIPLEREPWKTNLRVFHATKMALHAVSDPYFRAFDQAFPDYWRFKEWEREFDGFEQSGEAPGLMLVRLAHNHTGEFARAIDGVNTVETQVADNDYALGLLIQKVAASRFANDTLIFVIEDDAQDGPDHVDAHRSLALIAGPYVKKRAVLHARYNTVDLIRTMELILGLQPMGLNDALATPMAEVFDLTAPASWSFTAALPPVLRSTALPLPQAVAALDGCETRPARTSAYWAKAMAGQDFSREDNLNTAAFNLALWRGLKGSAPYPTARNGEDLSANRGLLLASTGADRCRVP